MTPLSFDIAPLQIDGQVWFAEAVRDFNPVHVDKHMARKSIFGQVIVHGMHSAIRQLDMLALNGALDSIGPATPFKIKINFRQPNYPNDEIKAVVKKDADRIQTSASVGDLVTTTMKIEVGHQEPFSTKSNNKALKLSCDLNHLDRPLDLGLDEIGQLESLTVALPMHTAEELADRYPNACAKLGANRLARFACLSSCVGMALPGMYSLFVSLECRFTKPESESSPVSPFTIYPVTWHEQFRFIKYHVHGDGVSSRIEAIRRPAPVEQPSISEVRNRLQATKAILPDLHGKSAIVIGGSRGLGATCAKILSCLGAAVTVTYLNNKGSAEIVCKELGLDAEALKYDALNPADHSRDCGTFDHIYYFATPPIFVRKTEPYMKGLMGRFINFYLDGFVGADNCFAHEDSSIYFPSSVEIESDDPNTVEYRVSKLSGEMLCSALQKKFPNKKYIVTRLPRLMTDQTATLQPGENHDTIDTIVGVINRMYS